MKQLKLFGRIACLEAGHPLRRVTLQSGSNSPMQWEIRRGRGRPCVQWTTAVHAKARKYALERGVTLETMIGEGLSNDLWYIFIQEVWCHRSVIDDHQLPSFLPMCRLGAAMTRLVQWIFIKFCWISPASLVRSFVCRRQILP